MYSNAAEGALVLRAQLQLLAACDTAGDGAAVCRQQHAAQAAALVEDAVAAGLAGAVPLADSVPLLTEVGTALLYEY